MKKFQFCQKLLVRKMPESIINLYNDFQEDYKNIMNFLVTNSGLGYCLRDENKTIVEPKEQSQNVLFKLAEIIGEGDVKPRFFVVVYDNHKSR